MAAFPHRVVGWFAVDGIWSTGTEKRTSPCYTTTEWRPLWYTVGHCQSPHLPDFLFISAYSNVTSWSLSFSTAPGLERSPEFARGSTLMSPDTITVHITNSLLCRNEIGKSNTLGSSLRDSPQRKGKHAFSEVIRQPTDPYCRTSFHNYTHSTNERSKIQSIR